MTKKGLGIHTLPGWSFQPRTSRAEPVGHAQVHQIMVPSMFETFVFTPHAQGPEHSDVQIYLMYAVSKGEIKLRLVYSPTHEVDEAIAWLRSDRPLTEWLRIALMDMAASSATAAIPRVNGAGERVGATATEVVRVAQLAIQEAHGTPLRRRRDRVTDELLREVAEVYQAAQAKGQPPTMTVAEQFYKSHSSAARWVSRARKAGHLPPAGDRITKEDR